MPLASAGKLIVERMRQLGQLRLWHKRMCNLAQVPDGAIVEEVERALAGADGPKFLAQTYIVGEMFLRLVPLRMGMRTIYRPFGWRWPSPDTSGRQPMCRSAQPK